MSKAKALNFGALVKEVSLKTQEKTYKFDWGKGRHHVVAEKLVPGDVIRLPKEEGGELLQVIEVIGIDNPDPLIKVARCGGPAGRRKTYDATFVRAQSVENFFIE